MTHVTCRLTAKNRDQLRDHTLGNRVWATFTFYFLLVINWRLIGPTFFSLQSMASCSRGSSPSVRQGSSQSSSLAFGNQTKSVLHSTRRCHAPCLEAAQRSRSACSPVPCTPPAATIEIKETVCRPIRLFSVNVIVCLCRTLLSCS